MRIISHVERQFGREISYDEISQGALSDILLPKYYMSITQVFIYF